MIGRKARENKDGGDGGVWEGGNKARKEGFNVPLSLLGKDSTEK